MPSSRSPSSGSLVDEADPWVSVDSFTHTALWVMANGRRAWINRYAMSLTRPLSWQYSQVPPQGSKSFWMSGVGSFLKSWSRNRCDAPPAIFQRRREGAPLTLLRGRVRASSLFHVPTPALPSSCLKGHREGWNCKQPWIRRTCRRQKMSAGGQVRSHSPPPVRHRIVPKIPSVRENHLKALHVSVSR